MFSYERFIQRVRILSTGSRCSGQVRLHMPHRWLCSRADRQLQARSRAKVTVTERTHAQPQLSWHLRALFHAPALWVMNRMVGNRQLTC